MGLVTSKFMEFASGNEVELGSGADASGTEAVAIGAGAIASASSCIACGSSAYAYGTGSAALMRGAVASSVAALACGYGATASARGAMAFGMNALAAREGELAKSGDLDGIIDGRYSSSWLNWAGMLAAQNPPSFAEVFLCGYNNTSPRCTIPASTVSAFDITAVARDNDGNAARYSIQGIIQRDGSNNTTLLWSSVTTDYEDIAGWDIQVSADDTNESLKVEFKGNDSTVLNSLVNVNVRGFLTEI